MNCFVDHNSKYYMIAYVLLSSTAVSTILHSMGQWHGAQQPDQDEGEDSITLANCIPIILLPTLIKTLTMIIIRRTLVKMKNEISPTQAAYLPGRGTLEQVLCIKMMAVKAISPSSCEYQSKTPPTPRTYLCLDTEIPAREAPHEYQIPVEQDPSRLPMKGWSTLVIDLKSAGIDDFS